jgi:hypothetical protein
MDHPPRIEIFAYWPEYVLLSQIFKLDGYHTILKTYLSRMMAFLPPFSFALSFLGTGLDGARIMKYPHALIKLKLGN